MKKLESKTAPPDNQCIHMGNDLEHMEYYKVQPDWRCYLPYAAWRGKNEQKRTN